MPSIADLTAASAPEIVSEIADALPAGWQFEYDLHKGGYFEGLITDDHGRGQWQDGQLDERLLLLNAFGWLMSRVSTARHPAWQRGSVLTAARVRRDFGIAGGAVEDPADLDPEQVESVYGASDASE